MKKTITRTHEEHPSWLLKDSEGVSININSLGSDICFHPDHNGEWMMKLTSDGKVVFNQGDYPNMAANDFATEVIKLIEKRFFSFPSNK